MCRLGLQDPESGTVTGLGVTDISEANASATWMTDIPVPSTHGFYVSINLVADKTFLSFAPRTTGGSLDLFQWTLTGQPTLMASFNNTHQVPFFGPLAETVSPARDIYIAGVLHNGLTPRQAQWELVVVQLKSTPIQATTVLLHPKLIGEINSIAGIGIPNA